MSTKLTFSRCRQMRWYSTKPKLKVVDTLDEQILSEQIKHRNHPGIIKPRQVDQPPWLLNTVKILIKDERISQRLIYESGKKLGQYLNGRHAAMEEQDFKSIYQEVKKRIGTISQEVDDLQEQEEDLLAHPGARKLFKELCYNWNPIEYDKHTSLSYLINRSVPEYSILYKIFAEINAKDTNFVPNTLFDFGSGIGTVMWAASQFWFKSLKEYVCIDISPDMHELSEYLSKKTKPQIIPHSVFYKQFLPASATPTYDIVISAFSLMELPTQQTRLEVIAKLWRKAEHYLIIVEQGTRAGFNLVNEAREFVLKYNKKRSSVHVLSPCPHDLKCPRYITDDTPCNFEIAYQTLGISEKSMPFRERYSYVVLKKGERPEDDPQWPRAVRPILKRSKHVICRLCTASGKLEEHIFTGWNNGRNTYRCARSSEWGDCLPFKAERVENTEESE